MVQYHKEKYTHHETRRRGKAWLGEKISEIGFRHALRRQRPPSDPPTQQSLSPEREAIRQAYLKAGRTAEVKKASVDQNEQEGVGVFEWPPRKNNPMGISVERKSDHFQYFNVGKGLGTMGVRTKNENELEIVGIFVDERSRGNDHYRFVSQLFQMLRAYIKHIGTFEKLEIVASNELTAILMEREFPNYYFSFSRTDKENNFGWVLEPTMTSQQAISELRQMRLKDFPNEPEGRQMLEEGIRIIVDLTRRRV